MTSTHIETATRNTNAGTRVVALIALAVTVAAAIAVATLTTSSEAAGPVTPSLERLRELASIYDGQQFGWVPSESGVEDTPAASLTDAERMRNWLIRSQGGNPDTTGHSTGTPSLESLRRMAEMYEGQYFGPGPLDD